MSTTIDRPASFHEAVHTMLDDNGCGAIWHDGLDELDISDLMQNLDQEVWVIKNRIPAHQHMTYHRNLVRLWEVLETPEGRHRLIHQCGLIHFDLETGEPL